MTRWEITVRKWMLYFICIVMTLGFGCSKKKVFDMTITHLRCEYLENPLGIDVVRPRLSWVLETGERGQVQTAYRLVVASSMANLDNDVGDLWDSGKVESDQSVNVVYDGKELKSRDRCYWKICAWDRDGIQTEFSEPAKWTMGLLTGDDWKSSWIAMELREDPSKVGELADGPPPPWFRKQFTVEKAVKNATAYVTARGLFELSLNGRRIGRDVFAPEWTDYKKRIHYRTYDVAELLKQGQNAVGAIVGDGWYSGYVGWRKYRGHYGFQNSLLVQLEVEYTDGTTDIITTDKTWKCSDGPIRSSDFMMGEDYDARLEMPGWNKTGFDDNSWQPVVIVEKPEAPLVAQMSEPVQMTENIEPVSISEPKPGVYVFDLGQNIAGWAYIKVKGISGQKVTLRFAERLNPDGTIYTENLRAARCTDTYILKGGGIEEEYMPRFTFHGFQYVEVTGFSGEFSTKSVIGCVVHSDTPAAGTFECSNDMVNKLWRNARWGQRGNFISVPTDCPQRDERLGWMGDAQVFIRTATFNMDTAAFYTKWMADVEDAQSPEGAYADYSPRIYGKGAEKFEGAPAWGDAGIIVPWTMYRVYGDTRIIERHYESMTKWMDFLLEANPNLIRRNKVNNNYGDWLSIKADTPKDLLATAYWAYDASLLAEMARVVGRTEDSKKYEKLADDIRRTFRREFVHPDGRVYPVEGPWKDSTSMDASGTDRVEDRGETQTGYLLALHMNMLPNELRLKAAEYLVDNIHDLDWHLSTGFVGCGYVTPVLTEMGYDDVAYRLLLNDTFPSWGYSIKQGATTIWERWDGWTEEKGFQDPRMNSFNHYSFGSIVEWMYRYMAGIQLHPDVPGYKRFIVRPYPGGGMDHVNAVYQSIHGTIISEWRWIGKKFTLTVSVPVNTTAEVFVPADEGTEVEEGAVKRRKMVGVKFLRRENGRSVFEVGSGSYYFKSILSPVEE